MNPERWQKIQEILETAAGHPPDRQTDVIREACGLDVALCEDVLAFHVPDEEVEEFIEEPVWMLKGPAGPVPVPAGPLEDQRIGPYRIERVLGRGGMGVVYLASREDDYRQQVALKLLSWNLGQAETLARFYNERQILASLQHPGIARLLDGGSTEDGLPYFVMEYVEGERIDAYCDSQNLSVRQRLGLFNEVCDIVHFAHQNLVVHRDLKANNILVTPEGDPRLLDFGIAKILQPELASRTVATMPGHGPMTPAYASPEQVLNQPITTACDVYALGVLLYRLLTGYPPYVLEGRTYTEMVELIANQDPPRPSATIRDPPQTPWAELPTIVPGMETEPAEVPPTRSPFESRRLERRLRGDLDSIILKAMRKEPGHRYGSAAELAEDIRRHLDGLPVTARKGTWSYHTGKFLRRHKPALAGLLLVLGFAMTATFLWRQAENERRIADTARTQAERQQARAVAVTEFLEDLFKTAGPDAAGGADLTLRELLDHGREKIANELDQEPEIRAEILGTLGTVYRDLGHLETAAEVKRMALEVRRRSDTQARPELAKDLNGLASVLYAFGDYEGAETYFRQALAVRRALGQGEAEIHRNLFNLASTLNRLGRRDEAEDLFRETLEIRLQLFGPAHPEVASCYYSLGALDRDRGRYEAAEQNLRQALKIRESALGKDHTKVAQILHSLGRLLHSKGDLEAAVTCYERAISIQRERFGEEHHKVALTRKKLADLLADLGRTSQAREMVEKALSVLDGAPLTDPWAVGETASIRGAILTAEGRYPEAEPLLLEAFDAIDHLRKAEDFSRRQVSRRLTELYEAWGRPEDAGRYRAS